MVSRIWHLRVAKRVYRSQLMQLLLGRWNELKRRQVYTALVLLDPELPYEQKHDTTQAGAQGRSSGRRRETAVTVTFLKSLPNELRRRGLHI